MPKLTVPKSCTWVSLISLVYIGFNTPSICPELNPCPSPSPAPNPAPAPNPCPSKWVVPKSTVPKSTVPKLTVPKSCTWVSLTSLVYIGFNTPSIWVCSPKFVTLVIPWKLVIFAPASVVWNSLVVMGIICPSIILPGSTCWFIIGGNIFVSVIGSCVIVCVVVFISVWRDVIFIWN